MARFFASLALLLTLSVAVTAQQESEWVRYYNEIATIDDVEAENWEETYNMLCEMEEHPIDLNRATEEDLEQLPFLTAAQIEDICEYLYMYGGMKTFAELQMIKSLDAPRRSLLQCFTYLGDTQKARFPSAKSIAIYGKHEVVATGKVPFYTRKGEKEGKYLGDKYKHSLRYTFNYGDYVKIGFTGAKDAGEPFFCRGNESGYDTYSAYLQLKHLGKIDVMVIGDYKLSFGMGLVANSGFNLGKMSMIANLGRTTNAIRGSSSTYNVDNFRGAAATIRLLKPLTLSVFASYKQVDGTMNKDSLSISAMVTSGYHRTQTEMSKKNNTELADVGANVNYRTGGLHIGLTALYSHISPKLSPNTSYLYRWHYPAGNDFFNASVNYGYTHYRLTINGETAMNQDGRIATINSANANILDNLSLMLLQRFYSYRYTSLHANSFASGGRVQNESGIYTGVNWQCLRHLSIMAYIDYAYFAWPRSLTSFSSHAWDNMLQASYSRSKWSLSARYRLNIKERDNEDKTALTNQTEHRARMSLTLQPMETLSLKTQVDAAHVTYKQTDTGYAVSQMATFAPAPSSGTTSRFSLHASITYFNSDAYNSRLYVYERGPLYSFYSPSFYGEGIRYTFMAKANVLKRLAITAKIGVTNYFDRSTIGSDNQMIDASSQTDLDLQLKWKI